MWWTGGHPEASPPALSEVLHVTMSQAKLTNDASQALQ